MPGRNTSDPPIIDQWAEAAITTNATPATTAANRRSTNVRAGFNQILFEFTTEAGRIGFTPRIEHFYHEDVSAVTFQSLLSEGTNVARAMLDSDKTGVVEFTMGATDNLYIATNFRIGGVFVTLPSPLNNNAATLTAAYSATTGFTAVTITDGTKATGPFEQAGVIELTTDPGIAWTSMKIQDLVQTFPDTDGERWHWLRLQTDNALDAVAIPQMSTLHWSIADTTGASGHGKYKVNTEYVELLHPQMGSIEHHSQAGAGSLALTWVQREVE